MTYLITVVNKTSYEPEKHIYDKNVACKFLPVIYFSSLEQHCDRHPNSLLITTYLPVLSMIFFPTSSGFSVVFVVTTLPGVDEMFFKPL